MKTQLRDTSQACIIKSQGQAFDLVKNTLFVKPLFSIIALLSLFSLTNLKAQDFTLTANTSSANSGLYGLASGVSATSGSGNSLITVSRLATTINQKNVTPTAGCYGTAKIYNISSASGGQLSISLPSTGNYYLDKVVIYAASNSSGTGTGGGGHYRFIQADGTTYSASTALGPWTGYDQYATICATPTTMTAPDGAKTLVFGRGAIGGTTVSGSEFRIYSIQIWIKQVVSSPPSTQVSNIAFSSVTYNSLTASWTNGDGARRAVFVKESAGTITNPTDGTSYTASSDWSSKGTQLGTSGYYCVYDGTGSSVSLTNLNPSSTYYVQAFEYNGSGATSLFLTTTSTNNPNNQATPAAPTFYYYRSKQTGPWSDVNSWESSTDNATWGSAGGAPTGTSADLAITILNGYNITVDAGTATADELTVANGGILTVASGATLSITNGSGTDLTVASGGSLVLAGSFASAASSTISIAGTFENQVNNVAFSAGSGAMTIAAGGVYKINGYNGTAQLTFTNVTFTSGIGNLGATLYLTGAFSGRLPATNNGNVTINSTGGGTFLNTNPTTISGNLTVIATTGTGINHAAGGSARNLTVTGDVTIQGGRYDIAGSGTTSGGSSSLTVNGTLTISGGKLYLSNTTAGGTGTLNVKGNVSYTAGVIGLPSGITTGHLVFNGTTAQVINISSTDSTLTTQNLTISNAAGITLSGTKTLDVKGYMLHTVNNSTFTTGGLLKLIATASNTATIYDLTNGGTNTGNTISGNVTLQQWVTGQRGYRVLSNPFNSALDTSNLASRNVIKITGANDVKTYNSSSNTWINSISSIPANTPYSVFIRGLASEVNGLAYSAGPTAFAYNVTGTLNGNSVTLNQNSSNDTAWTISGNPFAAPVKSSALTGGTAGTPYYVYSMAQNNTGTRVKAGGWVAASSVSSTTTRIPMMGVVAYQAGTSAGSTFSVASTSIDTTTANTIQTGLFGEGDATTQLELQVSKDGIYQDKLFVRFDANSTEKGTERMDLQKLNNDVTNIYTITSDKARLAVDARKGIDDIIPIGVTSTVGKYSFTVASNNFVNASNVYLLDKLTNTKTALVPGATYSFEITSDAATQGDNRFELGTVKTQVQDAVTNDNFSVKVLGNVVNNAVTVQVRGAKSSSVQITVVDMQGKLISNITSSREINNLALANGSGMYLIKVTDGENSIVSKVVKP